MVLILFPFHLEKLFNFHRNFNDHKFFSYKMMQSSNILHSMRRNLHSHVFSISDFCYSTHAITNKRHRAYLASCDSQQRNRYAREFGQRTKKNCLFSELFMPREDHNEPDLCSAVLTILTQLWLGYFHHLPCKRMN